MKDIALDSTAKEKLLLVNKVMQFGVVKMNQIHKSSNDIMKNEQKQVNVTVDVLEQAEEKKKKCGRRWR